MSGNFNMSFDPKVRQEFADVLSGYGLTVPQAFKLFANVSHQNQNRAFIL
ncbi:type II toxin-antitoxin system RelB/DinJ family antitoxin [Moraxella equi]|uniref:Addiction module antitoxin, RelB/DinJ family n=1 Tax=Moraxella equi TaxID=60442 RepID=A0A378QUP1_9GAMM|nr:type II toxin-antitoxin system RelB/DinJ family antitoxin [Moraxella equi]STZ04014.1 Uncharacterised protein [Moraxella equi]